MIPLLIVLAALGLDVDLEAYPARIATVSYADPIGEGWPVTLVLGLELPHYDPDGHTWVRTRAAWPRHAGGLAVWPAPGQRVLVLHKRRDPSWVKAILVCELAPCRDDLELARAELDFLAGTVSPGEWRRCLAPAQARWLSALGSPRWQDREQAQRDCSLPDFEAILALDFAIAHVPDREIQHRARQLRQTRYRFFHLGPPGTEPILPWTESAPSQEPVP